MTQHAAVSPMWSEPDGPIGAERAPSSAAEPNWTIPRPAPQSRDDRLPDRRQRGFAAVIGHELRNPLAGALASAHVVAELTPVGDPRRRAADRVILELERAADLLNRYLALGREDRVMRREFDAAQWLTRVAAAEPMIQVLGVRTPVRILGDEALLTRALQNHIENARQAGACTVTATLDSADHRTVLRLVDDGAGIPAELADDLFDDGVSGSGGNGLGLGIVQRTLRAHGGDVVLVSRGGFELRGGIKRWRGAAFHWVFPPLGSGDSA